MPSVPVNKGLRKALLFSVNRSSHTQNPWTLWTARGAILLAILTAFFPWLISLSQELCTRAHSLGFEHACCSCNALRPLTINLAVVIFSDRDSRPRTTFNFPDPPLLPW